MALFSKYTQRRRRQKRLPRLAAFESLEQRNMPAVLVDVGHHMVEPNASGQTVSLSVVSTSPSDREVAGFNLRAQIITAKTGPYFQGVQFAGNLWNTFPHVESGGPLADRTLALGDVSFTEGFETRADGTLVTLTIDTTGIPAGSYEFRLVATQLGNSTFRQASGSNVAAIIKNGTLQVRSIWQNADNPNDINGDGRVSPLDALLLLNSLDKNGSREMPMPSPGEEAFPHFDADGDGYTSPGDAIRIINCLNDIVCKTSPDPIFAKVTADLPNSTGDGASAATPPKTGSQLPNEVERAPSFDCIYYDLDENGVPFQVIDPDFCNGSSPDPLAPDPAKVVFPSSEPLSEETPEKVSVLHPASPIATSSNNFAVAPSAKSVDAVIVELAAEAHDKSAHDELVDLGLRAIFDI